MEKTTPMIVTSLRWAPEDYERIRETAKARGLTVSAYIREICLQVQRPDGEVVSSRGDPR